MAQIYDCAIVYLCIVENSLSYQSFEATAWSVKGPKPTTHGVLAFTGFVPLLNWFGNLARGCTVDMLPLTTKGWTSTNTGISNSKRNEGILLPPQVSSSITLVLIELLLHVQKSSKRHFIEALAHLIWHDAPVGAGYVESHGHGRHRFYVLTRFSRVAPNLPCLGCKKGTTARKCCFAHTFDDHGDDDSNGNNHSNSNI